MRPATRVLKPDSAGLVARRAPCGLTLTVITVSATSISSAITRSTGTAIATRFSTLPCRGLEPGLFSELCFSGAQAGVCRSGFAIARFLMISFLFIHGLVRLRHKFTERDGTLRIKPPYTNPHSHLVTDFTRIPLLEILFQ